MIANRNDLVAQVGKALKATRKSVNEGFSAIKMSCVGNRLTIMACCTEMSVAASLNVIAEEDFECAVNAQMLHNTLKTMTSEDVEITVTNKLTIKGGKSKINLPLMDPNLVVLRGRDNDVALEVSVGNLSNYVAECQHGLDTNQVNQMMTCFCLIIADDGTISITALDSKRVAYRSNINSENTIEVIVEGKVLADAANIALADKVKVSIPKDKSYLTLSTDNEVVDVAIMNGTFYKIDRIVEQMPATYITVDKNDLINSLNVARLLGEKVKLTIKGDNMIVENSELCGEGQTVLDISNPSNLDFAIGFNIQFMLDAIKSMPIDPISLNMANSVCPLYIEAINGDTKILEVVMPMKLAN